jgi:hypothetical protein
MVVSDGPRVGLGPGIKRISRSATAPNSFIVIEASTLGRDVQIDEATVSCMIACVTAWRFCKKSSVNR